MSHEEATKQVDQHFDSAMDESSKLETTYKAARPILLYAAGVVLIPLKWRKVIKAFVAQLDAITHYQPVIAGK